MSIESGLQTYLLTQSALTAIIASRIYPLILKDKSPLPAVTYQRIDTPSLNSMNATKLLVSPRFQFDLWAASYPAIKELSDIFRQTLANYTGAMGSDQCQFARYLTERDDFNPDVGIYRVIMEFEIWHSVNV